MKKVIPEREINTSEEFCPYCTGEVEVPRVVDIYKCSCGKEIKPCSYCMFSNETTYGIDYDCNSCPLK